MKKVASKLFSLIEQMSRFGGYAGMAMVLAIMVLITVEVILRKIFVTTTGLAEEYSIYFYIGLTYFALAYTLQTNRHIKIDVLTRRLSVKRQGLLSRIIAVLDVPFFAFLTWRSWLFVLENYRFGVVSDTSTYTPQYIPALVLFVGLALLTMQGVVEAVKLFTRQKPIEEANKRELS